MPDELQAAVIGGGAVGCWIAYQLSRRMGGIFVFEKNEGVTRGENQSSRNSGVNHAGIYYEPDIRPLKAELCVEGNRLWYEFCQRYDLPCRRVGKLIVAVGPDEEPMLDFYLGRAKANGVPGVRKIGGDEVRELEPNVFAHSALLVPSSGIFEPTALVRQVSALADNNGVNFMTSTRVTGLEAAPEGVRVRFEYRDGAQDEAVFSWVINAAGVHAPEVARMIDPSFPLKPALVRGDAKKFYRTRRPELYVRGMNVYPTPMVAETPTGRHHTVGVHLTPTFDLRGQDWVIGDVVTVGPKLVPIRHLEDLRTPMPPGETFLERLDFFPQLGPGDLEDHQSGIQARLDGYHDFYIAKDRVCPQVIQLVGLDSPALTAAPAIARRVAGMMGF